MVVKAKPEDVMLRSEIKAGAPGDDLAMMEAKYLDWRTGLCSTHQCKVYPRVFRVHNLQTQTAFVTYASYLGRAQEIHSKNDSLPRNVFVSRMCSMLSLMAFVHLFSPPLLGL